MVFKYLIFLVILLMSLSAHADLDTGEVHALAMHGLPKHDVGFAHFDYVNPYAPQGGTMRHGVVGTFDSFQPFIIRGRAGNGWRNMIESLMIQSWDEPFTLYGLLAKSVVLAPDHSMITFSLDSRARWHNGDAVLAQDVLFSWRALREHGRPNFRRYYNQVIKAIALTERRVQFHFARLPDGRYDRELPLIIALMPILSHQDWQGRRFDATTLTLPMGSGPYRITRFEVGRFIDYERVPDYWGASLPARKGHNHFSTIRYLYFRDRNVAFEAFLAGEFDVWRENDPMRWDTYISDDRRSSQVQYQVFPHGRPQPMWALVFNLRRPFFSVREVRHALLLAFDTEWINRVLFRNRYLPITSYYPNSELSATGLPSSDELRLLEPFRDQLPQEIFTTPIDLPRNNGRGGRGRQRALLRQAKRLLQNAGWHVEQDVLINSQGTKFEFEILLGDPREERIALAFKQSLRRLGIQVQVRTVDRVQYHERLTNFDFDMVTVRWYSSLSPGNEQLYYFGSDAAETPGSRNYPGIQSRVVDSLAQSLSESELRIDLVTNVRALDRVLMAGYYSIPLFYLPHDLVAFSSRIRLPTTIPLYGPVLETWWKTNHE